MTHIPNIKNQIEAIGLPDQAVRWLLDVWHVIQVFDDVADGDEIDRAHLNEVIWASLVGMPSNPFFIENASTLLPVLGLQIQKWQASDWAERYGQASEQSYMWRAGYYDLVLMVATICGPCNGIKAAAILEIYGESYEDYKREFEIA